MLMQFEARTGHSSTAGVGVDVGGAVGAVHLLLVLDLLDSREATSLTALLGPGEVCDGDEEEAVRRMSAKSNCVWLESEGIPVGWLQETSKGVVPGRKCGQDTKRTACNVQAAVRRFGLDVVEVVAECQAEECQVKREEQEEEGNGRFERAYHHEEGEDEPALEETSQRCDSQTCLMTSDLRRGRMRTQ